jgi:hypothetical protein
MPRKRRSATPTVGARESQAAARKLVGGRGSVEANEAAVLLGKRRMALMTEKEHREMSAKGGKTYWASLSEKERTLEIKRRAKVRSQNRRKALRKKLGYE